jgi:GT2 family glycosyltransferase
MSQRAPSVVVGIATRNRAAILPRAIESALAQGYANLRVSVWDDASIDDTPAVAGCFPQVGWTRSDNPSGLIVARNALMRADDAEYYVSLDDDAWFMASDEIAIAVDYLESNPRVGAVALDILSADRPAPVSRSSPRLVHMFIGCGHVVRLSAVRQAGYYSASPGRYGGEERDLSLRLLDRGWEICLLPGVHVWHDKTVLARDQAAQHRSGVCNDLYLTTKRCPLPHLLWILPYKIFSHVRFSLRHRLLRPALAGLWTYVKNACSAAANREPVRPDTFLEFVRRSRLLQ